MTSLVTIIDDDASVCRSMARVLKSAGYESAIFGSGIEFLKKGTKPNCILLDINMPGMTGLDLQEELNKDNFDTPIVFVTGNADIPKSVKAIKAGAIDFLEKPFEDVDLLMAVQAAIEKDQENRDFEDSKQTLKKKIYSLTPREYEVLTYVITGIPNKAIAAELGASEKTIKVHRGRLMQKMGAESIVELVRLADKAGVQAAEASE